MSEPTVTAARFIATQANLKQLGIEVAHEFGGGTYIKTTHIPAGCVLSQHQHDHDHLSVLVSGSVRLYVDGIARELSGFQVLTIEAGRIHAVESITDAIWLCVWASDCTDPERVDATILRGN